MFTELKPGDLLGAYRLVRVLGRGGMGTVWSARHEVLDRQVAIKVLPEHRLSSEQLRKRFQREARVMARLVHPNVVTIFDVGSTQVEGGDEAPYLVMELVHGESLERRLQDGPLRRDEVVRVASQIAGALAAAHAAGVVHRDLKPSNVMIGPGGLVKVLDFGLARLLQSGGVPETTLTTSGMVLGSCPYMSPEQATGEEIGPASDIFSFGSVLFEMLSGQRAFEGKTPVAVLENVAKARRPAIEDIAAELPPSLAAILDRCLERDPARRYPDGAALAADLATVDASLLKGTAPGPTVSHVESRPRALTQRRRRRLRQLLALVSLGLVAGLTAGLLAGRRGREKLRPDPGRWGARVLLQTTGQLTHPDWDPSGKWLAAEHLSGGRGEVVVVAADGRSRRILAQAPPGRILAWPRFSPDGSAIAVTEIGGVGSRVLIYPAVGGSPSATIENAERASWLGSRRLVFGRFSQGASSLWEHDLENGAEKLFLPAEQKVWWWDVRRDREGRLAVLGGPNDVRSGVWVLEGAGRTPVPWLSAGQPFQGMSWAPNGRSLVVSVNFKLARLGPRGLRPLVPDLDRLRDPTFGPGGDRLAVVRNRRQTDLIAVAPEGGRWSCLACGVPGLAWGSVGGGGKIVFGRTRGQHYEIEMSGGKGEPRRLTSLAEDGSCPVLSPEGTRIAYLGRDEEGHMELRVKALAGGEPVVLADGVENSELVSWAPDGRRLTYAGGSPTSVWTVAAAGGRSRRLAEGDYPQWSPDGSWIAYAVWTTSTDPNQGTWVVHPDGADAVKIGDSPTRAVWRPDGRALWQIRRSAGNLELWECAVGTWKWRRMSVLDIGISPSPYTEYLPFTVDPVSGRLALHRRTTTGELIVFSGIDPARW